MKKIISIVLSLVMVLGLVACGGSSEPQQAKVEETTETKVEETKETEVVGSDEKVIKIGVFEPQSGKNGGGGLQEVYGIRYANELYNKVKIGGQEYRIELVEADNKSDEKEAVTAAQKLISEKVSIVLGSYGSGVSMAAGEYFKDAGIPAIGCSCTNPQVTAENEYYFRTCYLEPFQGEVMASYCAKQGYKKVAVLMEAGDDYSEGLGGFFMNACKKQGIEVVSEERFHKDASEFKPFLTNIQSKNPDFIFAPSSIVAAPLILSQARTLGITCQIGAGDTWENGSIIDNAKEAAEGAVLTTFYEANPDTATGEEALFLNGNATVPGFLTYLQKLSPNEKSIPAVSALGYDSYLAAYKAIEKAQTTKGEDIRNALETLEYTGVTGLISYDEHGDAKKNSAFIKKVENGQFAYQDKVTIE